MLSRRASRGVTLIEMLVVVSIIGLLAGIALPGLSAGLDNLRLAEATDSVSALLSGALNRADRRQEPIEMVISTKSSTIELRSPDVRFSKRLAMPSGVRITAILPELSEELRDLPRRFLLLPGGTAPSVGLELTNGRGTRRVVRIDPITGIPRVERVDRRK